MKISERSTNSRPDMDFKHDSGHDTDSQSEPPDISRFSVPAMLTSAEVEALPSPFGRPPSDPSQRQATGVDMYSTDHGIAATPSPGSRKKSVTEAYDNMELMFLY